MLVAVVDYWSAKAFWLGRSVSSFKERDWGCQGIAYRHGLEDALFVNQMTMRQVLEVPRRSLCFLYKVG